MDFKTQDEEEDFTVFHNLNELEGTMDIVEIDYSSFKRTADEELKPYYMKA
jgi:hypothetical protein